MVNAYSQALVNGLAIVHNASQVTDVNHLLPHAPIQHAAQTDTVLNLVLVNLVVYVKRVN